MRVHFWGGLNFGIVALQFFEIFKFELVVGFDIGVRFF